MDMDARATEAVVRGLPEDEALRYKTLLAKPKDTLTDEERTFLRDKETKALRKASALSMLFGEGDPAGCTCWAGAAAHRPHCAIYGRPSVASEIQRLLRNG